MEAIFKCNCKNGKLLFHNVYDLERYATLNEGEELIVSFKPLAKVGVKVRMYAFYHGPLLDCAMIGYIRQGYEGLDKVKVDYLLRAEFAKDFLVKPNGEAIPIMLDKRQMTKDRLFKFITDCLFFIETELEMEVPDSQEYLINKSTSRNFKRIKD